MRLQQIVRILGAACMFSVVIYGYFIIQNSHLFKKSKKRQAPDLGLTSSWPTPDYMTYPVSNQEVSLTPVMLYENITRKNLKGKKVILLWTLIYNEVWAENGYPDGDGALEACQYQNCELTSDRRRWNEADALVFKDTDLNDQDLPAYRYPWQRYVFHGTETITHPERSDLGHPVWRSFFNWTATYMLHSDIYTPYNFILEMEPHRPGTDYMMEKSKMAVWISSRCSVPSQRKQVVSKLRKYIPIDMFGKCGKLMPTHCEADGCVDYILRTYKFVLAFENDLCRDWVTGHWFDWVDKPIIVVQLAHRNISLLPRDGVISVLDFKSASDLADRMKELANNRELYNNFFRWRSRYDICSHATGHVKYWCAWHQQRHGDSSKPRTKLGFGTVEHHVCGLCHKLNTQKLTYSSYPDIQDWWDECEWNVDWSKFG